MDVEGGEALYIHIVNCFPVGDNNAVKQRSKKSSLSGSLEAHGTKQKVDGNRNSYKQLKFQIKPSDSVQTDFR